MSLLIIKEDYERIANVTRLRAEQELTSALERHKRYLEALPANQVLWGNTYVSFLFKGVILPADFYTRYVAGKREKLDAFIATH